MKKTITVLAVLAFCAIAPLGLFAQKGAAAKKVVVVYFSTADGDKVAADAIAAKKNADVIRLEVDPPYDAKALADKAKFVKATVAGEGKKPPKIKPVNVDAYETVYIGTDVWNNGAPKAVELFINDAKLEGKKVIYYGTSTLESVEATFKKNMDGLINKKKAKEVVSGPIFKNVAAASKAEVDKWADSVK
jgi:flavodoxin